MSDAPRVVFARHHDEDDPGLLGEAFARRGFAVDVHRVDDGVDFPALDAYDAAVVLGSKWSVYDRESVGGWLDAELEWMDAAARAGVPLLGVCFGAQALTVALGGRVERSPVPEHGWVEIDSRCPAIGAGPWLQFHGDRCLPPAGVEILAENRAGVQAFRSGRRLGVQFHPEVEEVQLAAWIADGGHEELALYGVDSAVLLEETRRRAAKIAPAVDRLVGELLDGPGRPG